ncbi:MAG TPA: LytR C-terminal domain-containing protein [Candidatus Angelobacter sp.]|nr:LytR C-terminal domain-containing protein [Candidatus Angelobacter sp.]
MLSGSVLGPSGEGPRRRHPVATGLLVVLMMIVLFGATFGAVRLLKGDGGTPSASGSTPATCVTATATPGATLPKPATVTVNVYNATDRAGLARTTAATLKARGFGIGSIANDPLGKSLTDVAEIRYGPNGKDNALLLRYYVAGAVLVLDQRTDRTVDVALGLKYKAIPDQKVVDAALAKPVVVTTGSGCPTTPSGGAATTTRSASASPAG